MLLEDLEMNRKIFLSSLMGICLLLCLFVPVSAETTDPSSAAGWPAAPENAAGAGILMESSTGTVVYAKNADGQIDPSGAVKIMTTLVALENGQLEDQITINELGVNQVASANINIGSQNGEVFTLEQCLYAVMLASANDSAVQAAAHIGGGTVEPFVEMMNAKAQELGCTDTVFTNPTGISDGSQHTTPHDMALILRAAFQNETFRTMASATAYTIPATNVSAERQLTNNYPLLPVSGSAPYEGSLGGKYSAKAILAGAAEKDGTTLICVLSADASDSADAAALFNYGFENFQPLSVSDSLSTVSGGTLFVPAGVTADALTTQETPLDDGTVSCQYLYENVPVGTAVLDEMNDSPGFSASDHEQALEEARQYSSDKSPLPYAGIAAAGVLLFGLLIFLIRKVAKS